MVAVVAGNGLGLLGTSLQQLGLSPGGQSSLGQSGASQYVNIATGNLILQSQDERLVEQGLLAGVVRTYNSLGTTGNIGNAGGWLLGLDRKLSAVTGTLNTAGSTLTREGGDGEEEVFTYDATRGLYVASSESGADDTLQWSGTTNTWTYIAGASRNEETYTASGQLTALEDGRSGASYALSYNVNQQLIAVTADDGEALELTYDASGRVSSLCTLEIPPGGSTAVAESRVTYTYDTEGRLSGVTTDLTPDDTTDSSIFATTYTYDGDSSRIASLTQSDGLTVSYTYAQDAQGNYRIATVTTGSGEAGTQTLSFIYDTANCTTTVSDAAGRAWVYAYDANGNLSSITSPAVNGQYQVTKYTYTADGHLASVTDALGNQTIYQYDARGNRILERDADGNTITWTYNADDQVLTRTVYQVPDPDGAGPELASVPSTTWYVYDDGTTDTLGRADQLRYVIDADGNVSETQYNANGQVSLTRSFAGAAYDTSSLSDSTCPTLSQMDTWKSSQDLTQTTRVDYAYDPAGRLTGKTAWDNVDTSGNGIADNGESISNYVYDAQGLLRQQVTVRGADRSVLESSSYSYDGMGRLIGSTDAAGNTTTYAYQQGNGGTLKVTYANGLVHTEVRNSAGELVTVTESASDGSSARTTNYVYDPEGQLRAVQDPSGAISYTFYDETGRISGTVDAMGAVTQYVRDADGNVVETRQYATAVDTSSWISNGAVTPTDIAAIAPAASSDDRTTLSLYDAAGMHVADVDALGDVITYAHDGAGNLTTTTAYATALTADQLSALQDAPSWSALQGDLAPGANDRVTHTLYDIANRAVATIDAAGFVTTTAYDAAGRVIKTTAYANGLTAAQLAGLAPSPSLAAVLDDITASNADQTTRTYYDDAGRLIAQVDADGYLTTTTDDETMHSVTTTRYATALSSFQLAALTGHETLAELTADVTGSASQTTIEQYDADGRLSIATAVDGTITAYAYDAAGHLLSTTTTPPANAGAVRTTSATYDVFGDVLTATDAANNTATYTYNVLGQKVLGTDPLGNNTWYFYDADGRLVYTVKGIDNGSTQNALGEVSAITYNALGQVVQTTRYAGRLDLTSLALSTSTSLGAIATALQAIANPAQDATSSYAYTLDGLTASIRDGLGYATAKTYDAFGELTSVQQQLNQLGQALSASNSTLTTYSYDTRGEQTGEVDDAGGLNRTMSESYDAFGRVISRTDGNGNTTSYSYDTLGRQISVSDTVQGTARTTQTTYDAYGRVLTETDALGNVTTYQYSADTHTVIVTTPDGVKLTTVKDAYGDTLSVTDSLNTTTSYTYDADGRLLTKTDALGNVTTNAYDADGDLISSTDANGVVTTYSYDAAGRLLTRTLDPAGNNFVTTYAYDGRGQRISVTDPGNVVTTYSYDADGNVLSVVKAAGELNLSTTYMWDGAGHQLSVTQGAGTSASRTTQYTYDNLGRLIQTEVDPGTGHLNLTTGYTYDASNNLIAKNDADGNVTRYVYDEANERVFTIDAAGGVTQSWYDADGRPTSTRAYATALTATQLSSLGAAPSVTEVTGLVTSSTADQVSYTVYTQDGQVGYTIDALGYVTEMRHDADGRVSETLAYANAVSVSAALQGELQQGTAFSSIAAAISGAGNTDQNAQATLNLYDADGQVRFMVRQNTVNGQLVGIITEKRYDADGQVLAEVAYGTPVMLSTTESLSSQLSTSGVEQTLAGSTNLHTTQYVYSNVGTLRYIIDAGNYVTERDYDKSGNLTSEKRWLTAIAVPASLTTASVGAAVTAANASTNVRFTNYVYDGASRLISTTDNLGVNASYTYDALGQKLSYKNRDGATWTYVYDAAGRMIEQDTPPVAVSAYTTGNTISTATAAIKTRFTYDANGNVLTRVEAYGTSVARTISYAYDSRGNQIKTTYPGGSYASVTYNALGQAVVNRDVNGHYEYKTYDQDGRVAYEVDGNGYITAYSYDAYGNQTKVTRYANALKFPSTGWSAGQALGTIQVQQGLVASGEDRTIATTYDLLGEKTQVQQSEIEFVYNSGPAPGTGATAAPTTTYSYDAYGNVVRTSVLMQAAYGSPGQSGYTAPVWATTHDYYDALNRKTLEVDPVGYVSTWGYDAAGAVKSYTQYAKAISTSGLSDNTPPALPSAGDSASGFDRIFHYGYDSIGRKTNEIDYGGYSSDVSNAQSIAQGQVDKVFTYDGEDRVTSATVNGAKTTTTYDALGRVVSVLEPARSVLLANWQALLEANPTQNLSWASLYESGSPLTTITYDALGNALSSTRYIGSSAAGGSQTTYDHYDALGRVTSETDPAGTAYTNTYDAAGNLLTTTYTLSGDAVTTSYGYDADNQRLSSVTKRYSGGTWVTESATYVKYNTFGEIVAKGDGVTTYDADGYELTYSYDNAGNLISANDPKTGEVHDYFYDLNQHLLVDHYLVTGGGSLVWVRNAVDLDGRVGWQSAPSSTSATGEGAGVTHTYDRWDNVLSTTDARGYLTTYEYDSQNHLIKQIEPQVMVVASDGRRYELSPTKEWYYDTNGRMLGVTDENGHTTTNTYDSAGDLVSTTDAVGAVTRYAYDGLGRQVAKQTPITSTSWHITWQAFDALNRVIQQGDFLLEGSTLVKSTQQTYVLDQDGNRTKVTDAIGNYSLYTYDSQGRLLSSQTPDQRAAGKAHGYAYDVNGNKIKETTADGDSETWSYDYFGRVRSHTDLGGETYAYTYDANSGLLTKVVGTHIEAQSDPAYVPIGDKIGNTTESYSYYADGQVQQVTQQVTIGTTTYTAGTTSYKYDASGNQTDQNTHTDDGAGAVVDVDTQSNYDSHNRLSEVTQINTSTGAGIERTVYNYDGAGNRRAVFVQSGYDGTAINTGTIGSPTVSAIGTQTVQPGAALNFNAAAYFSDKLGFGLTYTGVNFPSWLHLNSAGVLFGTAPAPAESWTVTVTATDALGRSVSANVTVTVPVVNPVFSGGIANQTWQTGSAHTYTVPGATDANGSTIRYAATYYNGSTWTSTLPAGLSFNATTRTFSGTPPTGSQGSYYLAVSAYPADGGSAAEFFTLTVTTPASSGPMYSGGIPSTVYLDVSNGSPDSYTFPSTAFSSPAGEALTYSAVLTGSTDEPTYLPFSGTTRTFTANVTIADHNPSITLTAKDTQGRTVSHTFSFYITGKGTINNNAMPAGGTSTLQVGTADRIQTESIKGSTADSTTATSAATDLATTQATTQTTTAPNVQAYWFTYDYDNRVAVSGGTLNSAGQIVVDNRQGSMEQTYDLAGDVVKELTYSGSEIQTFSYDARGEMITGSLSNGMGEHRQYDADGRLIADVYTYAPGTTVRVTNPDGTFNMNIGGWLATATTNYYDADGRLTLTCDYGRPNVNWDAIWNQIDSGRLDPSTEEVIPASPPAFSVATQGYGVLGLTSDTSHWGPNGEAGYDNEGNALTYQYAVPNKATEVFTVSYLKKDGYLEQATTGSGSGLVTTTDTSYYDAFGRRVDIVQHNANNSPADDVRAFAYDANGQILEEREGSPNSTNTGITPINPYFADHYAYVNGQQVAHVDEQGTIDVLPGLTDFSNSDQGTTSYVVQDGDTLQSVAQQVYGDSNLWYVVADANGLQGSSTLTAGESLKLPQVKTTDNTANTFKPYNPNEISGSTTPSLPQVPQPPPSAHHCSALAEIVVIAVAVVVSVVTYGALSGEMAAWAAGAIAGAAGSAASQLAGDALGVSHGFDWGQVLVGAVGGAIGGGLSSAFSKGGALASTFSSTTGDGINVAGNAIIGAADYVGTYEAEKLVGEPAHFSWAGLIASAAGSAAGGEFGPTNAQAKGGLTGGNLSSRIESNFVDDVVTRETSVALGDSHVQSWKQIGEDVFGNALGNAAVDAINEAEWKGAEPSVNKQADSIIESVIGDDSGSDGSNIDPIAAAEVQAEARQEVLDNYRVPPNGPVTLPDIELGAGSDVSGLTPDEQARLATTTTYSGTYVDPYLIAQNGGEADWSNTVQTFRVAQDPAITIAQLQDGYIPPPVEEDPDLAARNTGLRIVGALAGIVHAGAKAVGGTVGLLGSVAGAGLDDVFGERGLGVTNYFHADTENLNDTIDSTAHFLSNHPLDTTVQAFSNALNHAAELSSSNNPMDQLESGDILGQLSFNSVMAVDGAVGLGKLAIAGAGVLADGTGQLAGYLGEQLSGVRFAGSGDGVSFANVPLGAVGGDLSGVRANLFDSADVEDVSVVEPAGLEDTEVRIGKSGFTPEEFAQVSYERYQGYVNDAYDAATAAESKGLLRGNPNTRIGNFVDRESALRYKQWLASEGVTEGPGSVVEMNRWLRDPAGSGLYVRPDIRIPSAGSILDATVGWKWSTDTQIMRFSKFSGGDRITIVRPQQLGGSYSILP